MLIVKLNTEITAATTMMVKDAMGIATNMEARLIVVEANTPGGEINAVKQIMDIFETSPIPVCLFVYPMGASAWSGGTYLLIASHIAAMASGTTVGSAQPILMTGELINDTKHINALSTLMVNHAKLHDRNGTAARSFVTENLNLGPEEALKNHVIEVIADDVPALLRKLSGETLIKVRSEAGASVWKLVEGEYSGEGVTVVQLTFSDIDEAELIDYSPSIQLGFLQIIFNPIASGLMFTFGFFLVLIGLQTPGFGSEFVGGVLLVLSLMSFQVIGIEFTMVLFFALGFSLIIAELKTNIGFLGFAGAACIILGSFLFFPSPQWLLAPEVSIRIRNILVATSTVLCAFFGFLVYKVAQTRGMKVMTGSEVVDDSTGVAVKRLDPFGEVRVRGEFWRARAEGDAIDQGTRVIVVGREGLLLIVRAKRAAALTRGGSQSKGGELKCLD